RGRSPLPCPSPPTSGDRAIVAAAATCPRRRRTPPRREPRARRASPLRRSALAGARRPRGRPSRSGGWCRSCGSLEDQGERILACRIEPTDLRVAPEPGLLTPRIGTHVAGRADDRGLEIDLAAQVRRPVRVAVRRHARKAPVDAPLDERARFVQDTGRDHVTYASL